MPKINSNMVGISLDPLIITLKSLNTPFRVFSIADSLSGLILKWLMNM